MLNLPDCHILVQDDIIPEMEHALVVAVGESPNCTIRIAAPDRHERKFVTVDRLTRASYTRKGDTWTFKGRSENLHSVIRAGDALLEIKVTPAPGCEECRK